MFVSRLCTPWTQPPERPRLYSAELALRAPMTYDVVPSMKPLGQSPVLWDSNGREELSQDSALCRWPRQNVRPIASTVHASGAGGKDPAGCRTLGTTPSVSWVVQMLCTS